jgi:hypothetical protein
VKNARERERPRELPPGLTPAQLRGWGRMVVLMWLAVPALPLLALYAGVGTWLALILGGLAFLGAVSYLVVYRLMRRARNPQPS